MPTFPPNVHIPSDMPDSDSVTTQTTLSDVLEKPRAPPCPSPQASSHNPTDDKSKASWRERFRSQPPKYGTEGSGKERWRDANLSEKDRWKDWQKAKDKEQRNNSTTSRFTEFYQGKGKTGYWLAWLWP